MSRKRAARKMAAPKFPAPAERTAADWSRMAALRGVEGRKPPAGGRHRLNAPRCPCECMTLKRAQARGKSSEHDPSCSFYRERAIII